MSAIKPDLIHIITLNVYKALVNTSKEYLDNPVNIENIQVKYAQDSAFNFNENGIRIRLEVILDALNKDNEAIGLNAEYGVEFHFVVDNMNEFIVEEGKTKKLKGILGGTLMGISYSTIRGIVFDRTQGTFFRGVILPVIDPNELIVN